MNKTLSIGLAGYSFIIDELAYIKLSDYLNALRSSLEPSEADEVMHDIEIRMVEIFKESLSGREVLNDNDVEKVIAQIGKPEIIEEQEEQYFSEEHSNKQQYYSKNQSHKVFFRDPEHQKIAGVCSGLAHYTGIEIRTMRGIWLGLALLGIFTVAISTSLVVIAYIILWVVVPEAKTASDFLKMKGKPLNFDSLKEQSNKVLKFAQDSSQKANEIYESNKPLIKSTGSKIGTVIRSVFGLFLGFIGVVLFMASMTVLWSSLVNPSKLISLGDELTFLTLNDTLIPISATLFLSTFIPALMFLFFSLKLLSPKTKLNHIGYVFGGLVLLWIIFSVITVSIVVNKTLPYSTGENIETENIAIATPKDSTIILEDKRVIIPESFKSLVNGKFYYNDQKVYRKMERRRIDILRKEGNFEPYLVLEKNASGYNKPLRMNVPIDVNGNRINLPNFVSYPFEYRFRDYWLNYQLVVPQYMKIIDNSKLQYVTDHNSQNKDNEDTNEDFEENFNEANININIKKHNKPTATTEISVNGKNWKILEYDDSYVIINDKKYPAHRLHKVLDSLHILKNYQDLKRWYRDSQEHKNEM